MAQFKSSVRLSPFYHRTARTKTDWKWVGKQALIVLPAVAALRYMKRRQLKFLWAVSLELLGKIIKREAAKREQPSRRENIFEKHRKDRVDEASMESFPASDPPAY